MVLVDVLLLGAVFAAAAISSVAEVTRKPKTAVTDSVEAKPYFKQTLKNITVGPGDRAVLKCKVENLGTKTVTWRKQNEVHPLTIGLFQFAPDTRISVDYNQRQSEWSLIIQDVRPDDEGVYRCQISTKHDRDTYDIKLNVKTIQVSGTEYVEKGMPIQLICNATGRPDPPHDVEWYRLDEKIQSDAQSGVIITKKIETKVLVSMIIIKFSKMSDAGEYVCRSSNSDVGTIDVHILNVPQATVEKRGTSQDKTEVGSYSSRVRSLVRCSHCCSTTLILLSALLVRLLTR